ncbi:hypothetical protein [Halostagnicola larsenii]|nr:hypothetical protein [Halostagnicola larsenii]
MIGPVFRAPPLRAPPRAVTARARGGAFLGPASSVHHHETVH